MNVNAWEMSWSMADYGENSVALVKLAVTRDHCVPVAQTVVGSYGGSECPRSL